MDTAVLTLEVKPKPRVHDYVDVNFTLHFITFTATPTGNSKVINIMYVHFFISDGFQGYSKTDTQRKEGVSVSKLWKEAKRVLPTPFRTSC